MVVHCRLRVGLYLCALVSAIAARPVLSDVVFTKNGGAVPGRIVHQSRGSVLIETANGRVEIQKANIHRIVFGETIQPKLPQQDPVSTPQETPSKDVRQSPKQERSTDHPSAVTAGLRSLLLPGWGQYAQGRGVSAAAFGFLFAGSVGFTLAKDREYHRAVKAYGRTLPPVYESDNLLMSLFVARVFDSRRGSVRVAHSSRSAGETGILVLCLLSATDAFLHRSSTPSTAAVFPLFHLHEDRKGPTVGLALRFTL